MIDNLVLPPFPGVMFVANCWLLGFEGVQRMIKNYVRKLCVEFRLEKD